jgi:hypothetical protein
MRIKIVACFVFLCIGLITFQRLYSAVGALQRIDVNEETAQKSIDVNFTSLSNWNIPNKSALKRIPVEERAALIRELGRYVKAYTQTEEFRKSWLAYRERQKPSPPEPMDAMPEMKRKQKENLSSAIREMEKNMSTMPKEVQASLQETVISLKRQLAEIDNPDNPMFSPQMAQNILQGQADQKKRHLAAVADWERDYPLTPEKAIRAKLEAFLKESDSIDFNAELVAQPNGRMKFKDPKNENMSNIRKMCFRSGKTAVDEARSFCAEWLKELAASSH